MKLIPYNRKNALDYARKWAYARNPEFTDFSAMGGDCTNFTSQVLLAGGMNMNFEYPFGWYFKNINDRSPSWTGVPYLYNFLTRPNSSVGPIAQEVPISELEISDIIQLSFDGVNWAHSLILVEACENDPKVATHSFDFFARPLSTYTYVQARGLHLLGGF